jgi:predicted acetyltransferase
MMHSAVVTIERVDESAAALLSNLLGLYMHDVSDIFPVTPGPDGRFTYDTLPRYWTDPDANFAFLIKRGDQVAGFALATRGSPATQDPSDLDVAEFFILRGHRRSGIGRDAAAVLWNSMPGRWIVRVAEANQDAISFWSKAIAAYTGEPCAEAVPCGAAPGWRVFRITSRHAGKAGETSTP